MHHNYSVKVVKLEQFLKKVKFINIEELCIKLINSIKNHESCENRTAKYNDKILTGYINVLNIILKYSYNIRKIIGMENNMINYLFNNCLFFSSESEIQELPKCVHAESRKIAYECLSILIKNSPEN